MHPFFRAPNAAPYTMPMPQPVHALKDRVLNALDTNNPDYMAIRAKVEKSFKKRILDYREKRFTSFRFRYDFHHKQEAEEAIWNDQEATRDRHKVNIMSLLLVSFWCYICFLLFLVVPKEDEHSSYRHGSPSAELSGA